MKLELYDVNYKIVIARLVPNILETYFRLYSFSCMLSVGWVLHYVGYLCINHSSWMPIPLGQAPVH